MPDYDYELVVIGGGPAGEKGAAQAAYFGHKTIVIEAYRELGGACINWGTLASKTLRESALFLSGFRTRQLGEGLNVQFEAASQRTASCTARPGSAGTERGANCRLPIGAGMLRRRLGRAIQSRHHAEQLHVPQEPRTAPRAGTRRPQPHRSLPQHRPHDRRRPHRRSQHGTGHLSRRRREKSPREDHSRRHRLDSRAASFLVSINLGPPYPKAEKISSYARKPAPN